MKGNYVTVVGNLTRDPEFRATPSGKELCDFGIAVNQSKPDGAGGWIETPHFFDCTVWDAMSANVLASLHKGDRVVVCGELQYSTWEKEGEKRSKVAITVEEIGPSLRWASAVPVRNPKGERPAAATAVSWDDGTEPF